MEKAKSHRSHTGINFNINWALHKPYTKYDHCKLLIYLKFVADNNETVNNAHE